MRRTLEETCLKNGNKRTSQKRASDGDKIRRQLQINMLRGPISQWTKGDYRKVIVLYITNMISKVYLIPVFGQCYQLLITFPLSVVATFLPTIIIVVKFV